MDETVFSAALPVCQASSGLLKPMARQNTSSCTMISALLSPTWAIAGEWR
jgi:hypothetical protein